jgi:tetratricopeptide (TPR) repeat protein
VEDVAALARLSIQLARFFAGTGDLERAEPAAGKAVALFESLRARSGGSGVLGELASAYHQLGYVQARRAESPAALVSFERAVALASEQVNLRPGAGDETVRLARIQIDYGQQLLVAERPADALVVLRATRSATEGFLAKDPLNIRYRQNLAQILNSEGAALEANHDRAAALDAFSAAAETADALLAQGPDDHSNQLAVILVRYARGLALVRAGQSRDGARDLRRAKMVAESILRSAPRDGFTRNELVAIEIELGATLLASGSRDAGCQEIGAGLRVFDSLAAQSRLTGETVAHQPRYEALRRECRR